MSVAPRHSGKAQAKWGYRHLVSDDKKVEMINEKLAFP
jgi:hypothetical protein